MLLQSWHAWIRAAVFRIILQRYFRRSTLSQASIGATLGHHLEISISKGKINKHGKVRDANVEGLWVSLLSPLWFINVFFVCTEQIVGLVDVDFWVVDFIEIIRPYLSSADFTEWFEDLSYTVSYRFSVFLCDWLAIWVDLIDHN